MEEGLLVPGIPLAMASSMQISPGFSPPIPLSKPFYLRMLQQFLVLRVLQTTHGLRE